MTRVHPESLCDDGLQRSESFSLLPNEKFDNVKKKPDKLDYHELPERYRICLSAFDDNNDGMIDTIELINAARMLRYSKRTTRRLYQVLFTLMFVIASLVGAIAGLTYYIVDANKDTIVTERGLMLNKDTKMPIATEGLDKVTHNYPSLDYLLSLTFDDLEALEAVTIAVSNGTATTSTKSYRVASTERMQTRHDGAIVVLGTSSGEEIHVSHHNTTFMSRDGTELYYMEKDGTVVLSESFTSLDPTQAHRYDGIVNGASGASSARFRAVVHTSAPNFAPATRTLFDPSKDYVPNGDVCEAFYDPFTMEFSRYMKSTEVGGGLYLERTFATRAAMKGGSYPMRAPEGTCSAITSFRIRKYDEDVCAGMGFWPSVGMPGLKRFKDYLLGSVFTKPTDVPSTMPECVSPVVDGVVDADTCASGWLALANYPRWHPWRWAAQQDAFGNVYIQEAPTNHGTGFESTTNATSASAAFALMSMSREAQMSRQCVLMETHMGFPDQWRMLPWNYANGNQGAQVEKWWRAPNRAYTDDDNELICHCLRFNFIGTPAWT